MSRVFSNGQIGISLKKCAISPSACSISTWQKFTSIGPLGNLALLAVVDFLTSTLVGCQFAFFGLGMGKLTLRCE